MMRRGKGWAGLACVVLGLVGLGGGRASGARVDLLVHLGDSQVRKKDAPEINLHHFYGGEKVTFNVDIKDMGPDPANVSAAITVSLSKTHSASGKLIQIVRQSVRVSLAPSATQRVAIQGTLPKTPEAGVKYFLVTQLIPQGFRETGVGSGPAQDNVWLSQLQFEFVGTPTFAEPFKDGGLYTKCLRTLLDSPEEPSLQTQINALLRTNNPSLVQGGQTPQFLDSKQNFIGTFEGDHLYPYNDSRHIPTIGMGVNLTTLNATMTSQVAQAVRDYLGVQNRPLAQTLPRSDTALVRWLVTRIGQKTPVISAPEDAALSASAIAEHETRARDALDKGVYDRLPHGAQIATLDLTYNAGSIFPVVAQSLNKNDLIRAAFNIVDAQRTNQGLTNPSKFGGYVPRTKFEFIDMMLTHQQDAGLYIKDAATP